MRKTSDSSGLTAQAPALPRPFLKWVGGKRQLLSDLRGQLPAPFTRYHEPFLGGGALFFDLQPASACLSDINCELISTYTAIRDNVEAVIRSLKKHRYDEAYYYEIRSQNPAALRTAAAAARMIYLNRCGYNGLYRVNSKGIFNVPFGRYSHPRICDETNLRSVSQRLQNVSLHCQSFETVVPTAAKGDLVYFDPPYIPLSRTSNFVAYQDGGFGMAEQEHLAQVFETLDRNGVHVILSNSDVPWMRERYGAYRITPVTARRPINARSNQRGPIGELIVTNY